MSWDTSTEAFFDELEKIAISSAGLSPETLQNYPQPQPMLTPGMEKAQRILNMVQMRKTAGARPPDVMPQLRKLLRKNKEDAPPPDAVDRAKSVGAHTLAGAGAARFVTDWAHGFNTSPRARTIGTSIGGAVGAAEYLRKHHREKKWKRSKRPTP